MNSRNFASEQALATLACKKLTDPSEARVLIGGLGMGGGGGGMGGFMTGRATADLLTRTTTVLAACFMASSLTLAILASNERQPSSILDQPRPVPLAPAQPGEPSVPLAR